MALVVTAAIMAIAVGLTEGDQGTPQASTSPTVSASESSSEPGTPTDKPSPSLTTSADGTVLGKLYAYEIPDGWVDITELLASQPTVDTVSGDQDSIQTASISLIVEIGSTFGFTTPTALKEIWKGTLKGATGVEPTDTADSTIAGKPAATVRIEHPEQGGVELIQYGWLLIVDNQAVSIVLTTSQPDKQASLARFEQIISTWVWK